MRLVLVSLLGFSLCTCSAEKFRVVHHLEYHGMCDASAAVAVSSNLFLVGNDEDNVLRLYHNNQSGSPLREYDLNAFLEVHGHSLEADLEGAALIGNRAYWIGSHGRNIEAKERRNRCRFFATDIQVRNGNVTVSPVGKPCKTLLDELLIDSRFDEFHFEKASEFAPKSPGALNIEGLAATPEGHLLIGFRNPIPQGKALLVPLLNPNEVIQGRRPRFGDPIRLDLEGFGIRDMAYYQGTYVIIAGSYHGGGKFRLYRWSGLGSKPELMPVKHWSGYTPETVILYPQTGLEQLQILSDDGTRLIDGCPCKRLADANRRQFRSFWVVQGDGTP